MVSKTLRKKVMEVAHDSIFRGHLGIKKTKDRIHTNFYRPRMQGDVTSFCRSCDVCQKMTAKGFVSHVPLGDMLLIDMPFGSRHRFGWTNFTSKREGISIYPDLGRLCNQVS